MAASRQLAIPIPHAEIAAFCRKWGIRKLSFFVVRDDFDPARSDVDVLVEYAPDSPARGLTGFGAEEELSAMLGGRKVDMMSSIRETVWPYVKDDLVVEYVEEG